MQQLPQKFARVVRVYRQRRDLSQEELASRAGIHRTYMSAIERGRVSVSLEIASRLATALGLKLGQLLDRIEE